MLEYLYNTPMWGECSGIFTIMMLHCIVLTSGECIGSTVFDYLDMSLLIQ